jgi:hypothetical protein
VVLEGMLADTAAIPAWRFCLVMTKFMSQPAPDALEA